MTESENNLNQINVANELMRTHIVMPCYSRGLGRQTQICPNLTPEGCSLGLIKTSKESVKCPEGRGELVIGRRLSQNEEYRLEVHNYANEIRQMEVAIGSDIIVGDILLS